MYNIFFEKEYRSVSNRIFSANSMLASTKNTFLVHIIRTKNQEGTFPCSVIASAKIKSSNNKILSNLNKYLDIQDGMEILYFVCFHELDSLSPELNRLLKKCEGFL